MRRIAVFSIIPLFIFPVLGIKLQTATRLMELDLTPVNQYNVVSSFVTTYIPGKKAGLYIPDSVGSIWWDWEIVPEKGVHYVFDSTAMMYKCLKDDKYSDKDMLFTVLYRSHAAWMEAQKIKDCPLVLLLATPPVLKIVTAAVAMAVACVIIDQWAKADPPTREKMIREWIDEHWDKFKDNLELLEWVTVEYCKIVYPREYKEAKVWYVFLFEEPFKAGGSSCIVDRLDLNIDFGKPVVYQAISGDVDDVIFGVYLVRVNKVWEEERDASGDVVGYKRVEFRENDLVKLIEGRKPVLTISWKSVASEWESCRKEGKPLRRIVSISPTELTGTTPFVVVIKPTVKMKNEKGWCRVLFEVTASAKASLSLPADWAGIGIRPDEFLVSVLNKGPWVREFPITVYISPAPNEYSYFTLKAENVPSGIAVTFKPSTITFYPAPEGGMRWETVMVRIEATDRFNVPDRSEFIIRFSGIHRIGRELYGYPVKLKGNWVMKCYSSLSDNITVVLKPEWTYQDSMTYVVPGIGEVTARLSYSVDYPVYLWIYNIDRGENLYAKRMSFLVPENVRIPVGANLEHFEFRVSLGNVVYAKTVTMPPVPQEIEIDIPPEVYTTMPVWTISGKVIDNIYLTPVENVKVTGRMIVPKPEDATHQITPVSEPSPAENYSDNSGFFTLTFFWTDAPVGLLPYVRFAVIGDREGYYPAVAEGKLGDFFLLRMQPVRINYRKIYGYVWYGDDKRPLKNIRIIIDSPQISFHCELMTNENGYYETLVIENVMYCVDIGLGYYVPDGNNPFIVKGFVTSAKYVDGNPYVGAVTVKDDTEVDFVCYTSAYPRIVVRDAETDELVTCVVTLGKYSYYLPDGVLGVGYKYLTDGNTTYPISVTAPGYKIYESEVRFDEELKTIFVRLEKVKPEKAVSMAMYYAALIVGIMGLLYAIGVRLKA